MSLLMYTEEDKQNIFKHYGKTEETIKEYVEIIQKWMEQQPHLPEVTDAKVIERFLMLNKYSIERTKSKLDMYYTVRTLVPEFYGKDPDDEGVKKVMDVTYCFPLPRLTKDLCRVSIIKARGVDTEEFDGYAYMTHTLNISEVRLREDYCLSDIHIYDLEGVQVSHLVKFTPTMARKGVFIIEKVFTSRAQGVHIINAPSFVNPFLNTIKSLLKPKLAARIFIHSDFDSLYKCIPRSILPRDYGGEEESFEVLNGKWKNKLQEYASLFKTLNTLRVNEDLRPVKIPESDLTGIQGNFRKLEVD